MGQHHDRLRAALTTATERERTRGCAVELRCAGPEVRPGAGFLVRADAQVCALGVGAGQQNPVHDLEFTTENATGRPQVVLPAFAIGLLHYHGPTVDLGAIDAAQRLHAEQSLTLLSPLAASGTLDVTTTVTDIWDKGSGALVTIENSATDPRPDGAAFQVRDTTGDVVIDRGELRSG